MKCCKILINFIITLMFSMSINVYTQMVQQIDSEIGKGKIDWEEGYIYATAVGTVNMDKMANEVHAEQQSIKTARLQAISILNETVNNIQIDSYTTFKDGLIQDDILKTETHGILKNIQTMKQNFKWTQLGSPHAEVTVCIPIYGGLSKISGKWLQKQTNVAEELPVHKITSVNLEDKFTGLIIDAIGLNAKPAFFPKILTDDGKYEVCGIRSVDMNIASIKGIAGYTNSIENAKNNKRSGKHPLIIKALKISGPHKGDFIISKEDAGKILAADVHSKFFINCNIVIVCD